MIKKGKQIATTFLRNSERYTNTDMVYVLSGGRWLLLGKGISMAGSFLLSVAFANLLSLSAYGTYRFILSLYGIVGSLTLTGMATAISQAVAQGQEHMLRSAFWTHFKWSIGVSLAAFGIAMYYFINDNNTLAISMLIVGSFAPFLESAKLYNAYLIGKKDFKRSTLMGAVRKLVPTAVMLGTLFVTDNPVLLIFAFFASNTLTMLSIYHSAQKMIPQATIMQASTLNYSKHLSVMNVIGHVSAHIDKILIFHFLGAAPLAVYFFALMPIKQLQSVNRIIQTLALPKFSNRPIEVLKKSLPNKAVLLFSFVFLVTAAYILAAPVLFQYLFPQYMDSVIYTQVVALTLLFAPNLLYHQTLIAHMKKKQLYIFNTTYSVSRIILFLILLPIYGIWGAVATILITKVLATITVMMLVRSA